MIDGGYRVSIDLTPKEARIGIGLKEDSFYPCQICGHSKILHYARSADTLDACRNILFKTNTQCSCNLYVPCTKEQLMLL